MSQIKLKHSGGNGVIIAAPASNPAADRTLTCPDLTANATLATVNGIREVDQWYLTSDVSSNGTITPWSRYAESGRSAASPLGTGMSHSSGIFTFPNPGKYIVVINANYSLLDGDNVSAYIEVTEDNSTYVAYANAIDGQVSISGSASRSGSGTAFAFVDVTDVTQVKVRFVAASITSGSAFKSADGQNGMAQTSALFVRVGDT